jgi:hypothetical protein
MPPAQPPADLLLPAATPGDPLRLDAAAETTAVMVAAPNLTIEDSKVKAAPLVGRSRRRRPFLMAAGLLLVAVPLLVLAAVRPDGATKTGATIPAPMSVPATPTPSVAPTVNATPTTAAPTKQARKTVRRQQPAHGRHPSGSRGSGGDVAEQVDAATRLACEVGRAFDSPDAHTLCRGLGY